MTADRPQWGVQVTAWRYNKSTVCLDWRTIQTGWLSSPPARGQHYRVLLTWADELTPAAACVLVGRMTQYMLRKKRWVVRVPSGLPFREVGEDPDPVPPGGGEGGEKPQDILPGQEPFPGLDTASTIMMPPTAAGKAVPEAKPRGRSSKGVGCAGTSRPVKN